MLRLITGVNDTGDKWVKFLSQRVVTYFVKKLLGWVYNCRMIFLKRSLECVGWLIFVQQFYLGIVVTSDKLSPNCYRQWNNCQCHEGDENLGTDVITGVNNAHNNVLLLTTTTAPASFTPVNRLSPENSVWISLHRFVKIVNGPNRILVWAWVKLIHGKKTSCQTTFKSF